MAGKGTVITGASSGIWAALARRLGEKGHDIVLAARRESELNQVASQVKTKALAVRTDVTRRHEVSHLLDLALKEYGHVDVWVNNAGRGITRPVMNLTEDDLDEIISVVLKSVVYGMKAIIPHFQDGGAVHTINVSSFLRRAPLVRH